MVLRSLPDEPRAQALVGDLEELWQERRLRSGRFRAGFWYLTQAATVAWSYRHGGGNAGETGVETIRNVIGLLATSARVLWRAPSHALATAATLSLGVAATTTVFALVRGVLLEALPYPDGQRIVFIHEDNDAIDVPPGWATVPNYLDWRQRAASFDALALFRGGSVSITTDVIPEYAYGALVTPEFFDVFGIEPALGRRFSPGDGAGEDGVVILGHGLWTRGFAADPALVGRSVRIDGQAYTVIGIMPQGFEAHGDWVGVPVQIWRPFRIGSDVMGQGRSFHVAGRLASGVALEQARREMAALGTQLAAARPEENAGWYVRVDAYRDMIVGDVAPTLWLMLATTSVLLLIAAANVAGLSLNRTLDRTREIATRRAIGGSRRSVVGLVLAESSILAIGGGLLGIGLAHGLLALVRALEPARLPRLAMVGIDGRVLLFCLAVVAVATLGSGGAAALAASRTPASRVLRGGGARSLSGGSRSTLVAGQLALSFGMLVTAGLLVRSFHGLRSTELGFDVTRATAATVALSWNRVGTLPQRTRFSSDVLAALRAIPGVASAGMINSLPLSGSDATQQVEIEGLSRQGEEPALATRGISPGYLESLRIPILEGRDLEQQDVDDPHSALVNRAAAERYWPGTSPLGRRVRLRQAEGWLTVVGVVGDVRHYGPDRPTRAELYVPYSAESLTSKTFVVRWQPGADIAPERVREAIFAVDPDQPVREVRSMEDWASRSTAAPRLQALTMTLAAVFATLLASVGLFGVLSGLVRARTPELALRVALGAQRGRVLALIARRAVALVGAGVGFGTVLALSAGGLLERFLFGVSATDPVSLGGAALLFVVVTAAASVAPARRAMSLDPARALRAD
jgi:putative ABC transport system permease protein